MSPFPALLLQPVPVARPWGGRRAAPRFGWADTGPVGEWWLASCQHGATTPVRHGLRLPGTGTRGPAASAPPPLEPLTEWLAREGAALGLPAGPDFPLLVKFLDSEQVLSLQVHPDDRTAAAAGLASGKTEAWHVLAAEPGACVWLGTAPGTSARHLIERVRANAADDELHSLLRRIEVHPGDTLLVRAGSVHAIGPGLLLYEIQQNADTTWRIHDWGRGRPTHLDDALRAVIDHPEPALARPSGARDAWEVLADCDAFRLAHARVDRGLPVSPRGRFSVLTVIGGRGALSAPGGELPLAPGDTLLLLGDARLSGEGLSVLAAEGPA